MPCALAADCVGLDCLTAGSPGVKHRYGGIRAVIVLALAAGAVSAVQVAVSPQAAPARADSSTGTAGLFVPTQGTVLDTRTGIGGVSGPVAANTWYPVQVAGQAGVPATGVSSVQVSITVLTPTATGLVKVAANGTAGVPVAALTYTGGGGSISASSIVALASDGKIAVLAQTSVTLLVHVQGYYTAGNGAPAPGGYVPVNPARMVDTRNGTGLPQAKLATGSTTAITVGGLANVPADASAVFVMLTAISTSTTAGYFSPYPTGTTRPGNVSLNYLANTATILGAAVDLGTGGQFNLWVGPAGTAIDVVVDVVGYYTATPGTKGAFTPAATRAYDSRIAPNIAAAGQQLPRVPVGGVSGRAACRQMASAPTRSAPRSCTAGIRAGSLALGPGDEQHARRWPRSTSRPGRTSAATWSSCRPARDGTVLLVNSSRRSGARHPRRRGLVLRGRRSYSGRAVAHPGTPDAAGRPVRRRQLGDVPVPGRDRRRLGRRAYGGRDRAPAPTPTHLAGRCSRAAARRCSRPTPGTPERR